MTTIEIKIQDGYTEEAVAEITSALEYAGIDYNIEIKGE